MKLSTENESSKSDLQVTFLVSVKYLKKIKSLCRF